MSFKIHFMFSFFLFFYIADAFNITEILNKYSDFSTFNSYLTQTNLAGNINSRKTITVLAVSNDQISAISGKTSDVLKSIMGVHVILDYYDVKRFQSLQNKTSRLTTLLQTTGKAKGDQGYLNATASGSVVKIGSSVTGAETGASLIGSVTSQPYDISVLQISHAIVPEGIDNITYSSTPTPSPKAAKSPTPAKSPSPGKSHKSPPALSPSPSEADSPAADSPDADSSPSLGMSLRLSLEAVLIMVSCAMTLAAV